MRPDPRIDDREVHGRRHVLQRAAQDERAGAHVVAGDAVGDVDDPDVGRDLRDDPVADADEVVAEPVVAEERHDRHARVECMARRPGNRSAMRHATHAESPEEPEVPSGMPEGGQDEDLPLGVPPDDEEADRELPGFPEGDIDTAG